MVGPEVTELIAEATLAIEMARPARTSRARSTRTRRCPRPSWRPRRPYTAWPSHLPAQVSGAGGERILEVRRLGRTLYADAHRYSRSSSSSGVAGALPDVLLLTEHEPVVTIGRGAALDVARGVALPVVAVERGGEATWHGPGQLVGYPIVLLPEDRRDLHRWLRDLEEVVIRALRDLRRRRPARERPDRRLDRRAQGLLDRRRRAPLVTWHGFALNVTADLAAFRTFQPCGLDPALMTRLADHARPAPPQADVESAVVAAFAALHGYTRVDER